MNGSGSYYAGIPPGGFTTSNVRSGTVSVRTSGATYSSLEAQSRSIASRLADYNNRASLGTYDVGTYNAMVSEQRALGAEIDAYNAQVLGLTQ